MFCSQCGNKLEEGQRFCVRCGQKVGDGEPVEATETTIESSTEHPAAVTPQFASDVVWILQATHKYGMFKLVPCSIIFKKDRLLLAHLTPALQKAESSRLSKDIKSEGLGFFKGSAAMMRHWSEYYKRYYTMTEAAIISEDPTNVVIYISAISEFRFKCLSEIIGDSETADRTSGGTLDIALSGSEKIKFTHKVRHSKAVKETLLNLFGNKLNYKT